MEAVIVEVKKQVDEASHIVGVLQVQLDAAGAELKNLEVEVASAKSEVTAMGMKVRVDMDVAQSKMAKANTEAEESRKERYEATLFDIRAAFPELDLSGFSFLKECQAKP